MSYRSLYRRRRPMQFSEMVGQEHVSRTLSHALVRNRLAHAYLFCGPRGTGKTTAAKILARALNCERYPAPEPCGECLACRNIAAGVSIDVLEMDAASNRGIDEIRELRERTRYAPGEGRFKVFIIDEVHMLTSEAFNAFLKTLEEPPPGVVFILATTDPAKLPPTIISRCQRFDFHLLTSDQIYRCLNQVVAQEGWLAEEEALRLIARLAEGSLRDALGLLEQAQAYGEDLITAEHLRLITGATRAETIARLVEALADNDLASVLLLLEEVVYSGRNLALFVKDLLFFFSRLLLGEEAVSTREREVQLHGFQELLSRYRGGFAAEAVLEIIELLYQAGNELRYAQAPRFILEVAFIRMLRRLHGAVDRSAPSRPADREVAAAKEPAGLFAKHEPAGQAGSGSGRPVEDSSPGAPEKSGSYAVEGAGQGETVPESDSQPEGLDLEKLIKAWPQVLEAVKRKQRSTCAYLLPASLAGCQGGLVTLGYDRGYEVHRERVMESNHRRLVEEVLSRFCGRPVAIEAALLEKTMSSAESDPFFEEKKTECNIEEALQIFNGGKVFNAREQEEA